MLIEIVQYRQSDLTAGFILGLLEKISKICYD